MVSAPAHCQYRDNGNIVRRRAPTPVRARPRTLSATPSSSEMGIGQHRCGWPALAPAHLLVVPPRPAAALPWTAEEPTWSSGADVGRPQVMDSQSAPSGGLVGVSCPPRDLGFCARVGMTRSRSPFWARRPLNQSALPQRCAPIDRKWERN